jgi:peptidoglycan/LPS O-acetylase OafA/YrhL
MGTLRLLLAASVIAAHAGPILGTMMVPGNYAVETFFMISGFYMSLILNSKYLGKGSRWKFYSNRFVRLYPTYLIVACATWSWFFFVWFWLGRVPGNSWMAIYPQLSASAIVGIIFSNWTMVGLDIPSLYHFSPDQGLLPFHYYDPTTAPDGAIWFGDMRTIGQAWSVGLEIWFYFLAPFLTRLPSFFLVLLACLSCLLKAYLEWKGILTYFFFPAQLWYFIVGMIGQRVWSTYKNQIESMSWTRHIVGFVAALTLLFPFWPVPGQRWIYYAIIATSLPLLFGSTRKIGWDRWVGNLSYPVYMTHMLVLSIITATLKMGHPTLVLSVTLITSIFILKWVEEPLDQWRQRRVFGN